MKLGRRGFLGVAGFSGGLLLAGRPRVARAEEQGRGIPGEQESAVLVDTTRCVGCRGCEAACSEAHGLPPPDPDDKVFESRRSTSPDQFTVVNRFPGPAGAARPHFAKSQCMHCVSPACASACPVRALQKSPGGPVFYDGTRCLGCRYCMVACPFGVPRYQYEKAAPYVRKCDFCASRQAEGKAPACASVCPSGALTFGKRGELLDEAKRRIYGAQGAQPGRYLHRIYGEHEAGGTDWLYLSDIPSEELGLDDTIARESYPRMVDGALSVPPIVMALWPPLLMGLRQAAARRNRKAGGGEPGAPDGEEGEGHE